MKIKQQFETIQQIKVKVDEMLTHLTINEMKSLIFMFHTDDNNMRLCVKDNQLIMLNIFFIIWREEQQKLPPLGITENIFKGVHSLDEIEKKYLSIKFGVLRLETEMPQQYYEEAVGKFIADEISGVALFNVIEAETEKKEQNIIVLSRLLKQMNAYQTAVILLQEGEKKYLESREILVELADCWIVGKQWNAAYDCYLKIKVPLKKDIILIKELEKVIANEKISGK